MKKYLIVAFIGISLLTTLFIIKTISAEETPTPTPTPTVTPTPTPTVTPTPTPTSTTIPPTIPPIISNIPKEELRQELSIKEIRGRIICKEANACPMSEPNTLANTEVLIKAAKVLEVNSDYLKISIFGYNYKVDLSNSKIVRHYWGESSIDEVSVGDIVNVFGFLDESDSYLIHAKTLRNVSIQKVHNVFKGVIESIDTTNKTFVLKTEERGNQTVVVGNNTKIIKSQQVVCVKAPCSPVEIIGSFSDLQVGIRVIVRGLWDKTLSKIQAQIIIIGNEENPRPFFVKPLPAELQKLENKVEKFTEKMETKMEKAAGQSAEAIKTRIEELQKKIAEILKQLKPGTSTP